MPSQMHVYTIDPNEIGIGKGYYPRGPVAYVYPAAADNSRPLYRWRHPVSNLHFYTVDPSGENASAGGYVIEKGGAAECFVPLEGTANAVPMFRYYDANQGDHYFTQSPKGDGLPEYSLEGDPGIAFYAFPTQLAGTVPLLVYSTRQEMRPYCVRIHLGDKVTPHDISARSAEEAQQWGINYVHGDGRYSVHVSAGACN